MTEPDVDAAHVDAARADTARGEHVLRRRADGALELRVNGILVVDTAETSSERELASASLALVASPRRVLVAGLGLGFTLRAVLEHAGVEQVTVVEREQVIVDWVRAGLVPGADALLADARVSVRVDDIAHAVPSAAPSPGRSGETYDVVLLDVDNGPDHLVHDTNAHLYDRPFLRRCAGLLADGGVLVVWSMNSSAALLDALGTVFGRAWAQPCPARLGERDETYWLHLAGAAGAAGGGLNH